MKLFIKFIALHFGFNYFESKYHFDIYIKVIFYLIICFYFIFQKRVKIKTNKVDMNLILKILVPTFLMSVFFNLFIFSLFPDFSTIVNTENYNFNLFFLTIILLPFFEEFVYRNLLLSYLLNNFSKNKAILYLSFGFTFVHLFSDSSLFLVFIWSVFISYIYIRTNNFILVFFIHALNNIIVSFFIPFIMVEMKLYSFSFFNELIFVLMILFLASLILLKKEIRKGN